MFMCVLGLLSELGTVGMYFDSASHRPDVELVGQEDYSSLIRHYIMITLNHEVLMLSVIVCLVLHVLFQKSYHSSKKYLFFKSL